MKNLELTDDELAYLVERIAADLSDLRAEICGTDSTSYKRGLQERKGVLIGLLDKLVHIPQATA